MDALAEVRAMVVAISAGSVLAYGEIGQALGIGPRQAGRAVALLGDDVPWWRVVHADGVPATCHAGGARALLEAEGIPFRGDRVAMAEVRADRIRRMDEFDAIRQSLVDDRSSAVMRQQGWQPLYTASATARIVIIGQAPGRKAQTTGVPWDDASGKRLIDWLGVTEEQFRDPNLFALLPMDFYYPGAGRSGDLPPRKEFAERWHPPLLALMPDIRLTLLIGRYAQIHYLPSTRRDTLTNTVRQFRRFVPELIPLVHPSPLNFRWQAKNPWFDIDVLPELRAHVRHAVNTLAINHHV